MNNNVTSLYPYLCRVLIRSVLGNSVLQQYVCFGPFPTENFAREWMGVFNHYIDQINTSLDSTSGVNILGEEFIPQKDTPDELGTILVKPDKVLEENPTLFHVSLLKVSLTEGLMKLSLETGGNLGAS